MPRVSAWRKCPLQLQCCVLWSSKVLQAMIRQKILAPIVYLAARCVRKSTRAIPLSLLLVRGAPNYGAYAFIVHDLLRLTQSGAGTPNFARLVQTRHSLMKSLCVDELLRRTMDILPTMQSDHYAGVWNRLAHLTRLLHKRRPHSGDSRVTRLLHATAEAIFSTHPGFIGRTGTGLQSRNATTPIWTMREIANVVHGVCASLQLPDGGHREVCAPHLAGKLCAAFGFCMLAISSKRYQTTQRL